VHQSPPVGNPSRAKARSGWEEGRAESARLKRLLKKSLQRERAADSSELKPLGMTKIKGLQPRSLRQAQGKALKVRPFKATIIEFFSSL
jgi:hypothetical protein